MSTQTDSAGNFSQASAAKVRAENTVQRFRLPVLSTIAVAIIAIVVYVISTQTSAATGDASSADGSGLKRVYVGVAEVGQISEPDLMTRFRGVVEARREGLLAFRRSGRVVEVTVDAGDEVPADSVIARLDVSDLQAQADLADAEMEAAQAEYAEAVAGPRKQTIQAADARVNQLTADLKAAEARLARKEQLVRSNVVTREEYDDERFLVSQRQAAVAAAQAELAELKEGTRKEKVMAAKARLDKAKAAREAISVDLADSEVVAPFAVFISERMVDEGVIVGPNQPVVSILEAPPLEAKFGLPAEIAGRLKVGEELFITVGKGRGRLGETPTITDLKASSDVYQGRVVRLQPNVDAVTRTRLVVIEFDAETVSLIGQTATLWLPWAESQPELSFGEAAFASGASEREFWIPTSALVRNVRGLWGVYVAEPQAEAANTEPSRNAEKSQDDSQPTATPAMVKLRDVRVETTAGAMTLVSGMLASEDLLITDGTHRVGPNIAVWAKPVDIDEQTGNVIDTTSATESGVDDE